MARRVKSQYSSRVSPFQAKTGVPVRAMAAAAWSWVEKMLHEAQRTSAPSSLSVSMRTAVWIVMCSEPVMRTSLSGLDGPNFLRTETRPGISCSAMEISLRPQSASVMSLTWKSAAWVVVVAMGVMIGGWGGVADGVGDRQLGDAGQAGRHIVLGPPAAHVSRGAIDLRGTLA